MATPGLAAAWTSQVRYVAEAWSAWFWPRRPGSLVHDSHEANSAAEAGRLPPAMPVINLRNGHETVTLMLV
jgi:hypothetical protein